MTDTDSALDQPYTLDLDLDRDASLPLYQQIATPLEDLILAGRLQPGQLIEDEVSLAQRLNVSRPTARRALQDLVARGLLTRRRGVGTRVTPSHVRRPLALTSLNDDLVKAGFSPRTEVLSYEVKLAQDEEADLLGCEIGEEVVRIERRRWIDDRRLAVLTNLLPAATAPSLTRLSTQGLYECLEEDGVHPTAAHQVIGACIANQSQADQLGIQAGEALLTMQRTAYDHSGAVVEYGTHFYNASLYSFQLNLASE